MAESHDQKLQAISRAAKPLKEIGEDYSAILKLTKDAEVVLLGESTHGTHEFYYERAQITKLLIKEQGFSALALEADWPDAYRVNTFIHGGPQSHKEGMDALSGFSRFPQWMWNNADVLDLIGWLRDYNQEHRDDPKRCASFFGLDLYSLYNSAQRVIEYLEGVDRDAAERARARYSSLTRFGEDGQEYAYATKLGLTKSCKDQVISQLMDLLKEGDRYRVIADGNNGEERFFDAEQNSRLVVDAERYYRTMLSDDVSSWNLRDEHMADTLQRIREHLVRMGRAPKVVVWAHNSHIGDARWTDMGWHRDELNIGQLARQAYGPKCINIGFTTYSGSVTAASRWNGQPERKRVREALRGSYELLFHEVGKPRFLLDFRNNKPLVEVLESDPQLERAIGVLYLPQTERRSHYFKASIAQQFDAVIHIDHTRAVEPTKHEFAWEHAKQTPETFPSGF